MLLTFHMPVTDADRRMFPHGYWYAEIMSGGFDGVGATPLDALAQAVASMEKEAGQE